MLEQGISRKFKKISTNKMKIIDCIVQNDEIIKHSLDLGKINIDSIKVDESLRREFFKKHLILDFFTHDLHIEDIVYYMVTPLNGYTAPRSPLSTDIYTISIICPARYWYIQHKMQERPFVIAQEIAESLDQQREFGVGQIEITQWRAYRLNDDFACLELTIQVSDMAVKR